MFIITIGLSRMAWHKLSHETYPPRLIGVQLGLVKYGRQSLLFSFIGPCPTFYSVCLCSVMANFRINVLAAAQVARECSTFHFL